MSEMGTGNAFDRDSRPAVETAADRSSVNIQWGSCLRGALQSWRRGPGATAMDSQG
ncbi:hypothetical protein FOMPIDRAFT_87308 [Fomitopsis schrenkii]|uniref:Uncharacterized protein n=1 Tax=Fomitopsis schrenkii TaxID=2126942 RepID=S8DPT1_FOMSC|nr:hypothetical protein FOMPIDRAFT_87308 [Fomitopsis schrenkii]